MVKAIHTNQENVIFLLTCIDYFGWVRVRHRVSVKGYTSPRCRALAPCCPPSCSCRRTLPECSSRTCRPAGRPGNAGPSQPSPRLGWRTCWTIMATITNTHKEILITSWCQFIILFFNLITMYIIQWRKVQGILAWQLFFFSPHKWTKLRVTEKKKASWPQKHLPSPHIWFLATMTSAKSGVRNKQTWAA